MATTPTTLERLFTEARTHNVWLDKSVDDAVLKQIYETTKWGPTSMNAGPARIVFVRPGAEREKLLAAMMPGNVEKTRTAPVTAIIAYDAKFYDELPRLFPHADVRGMFATNEAFAKDFASHNTAMQAAYFIIAARAHGLDAGPMAGFDKGKLDEAFFAGTDWKSHLVINLGYGDAAQLFARGPRLTFDEACRIV